ncbi:hypothetical protein [Thorsellia anophelis]|uniref:Uncharacterized protein n=1 Tax=Thorsellia anophelis DSM 18579 TaxID=1123402 RepID=A0A1I0G2W0_9GAMM|nr:hypothetical protein [Thorsellia anophelis]SET64346.1 hypothetical protein SAMN02583745_02954 [Thorsellia anophelis DSM 18579]
MIDLLKPLRSLPVKSHLLSTPQLEVYEPSSAITIERYQEIKNFLESNWHAECLMSKIQYRNKGSSKYLVDTPTCFIQAINPDKSDPSFVVFAIYFYANNYALSDPELFLRFNPMTQKLERFDSNYLFRIDNEFYNNREYSEKIETPAQYKANIATDFEFIEPTYQLINVNGIIYSLHDPIVSEDKKVQVNSPD